MRRHQLHTRIEARNQIRAHLGNRHLELIRELLRHVAERDVALPEESSLGPASP